jgi:hypothetical protein
MINLNWSRWISIPPVAPQDVSLSDYDGPVLFRCVSGLEERGECVEGCIEVDGKEVADVVCWKPAPVKMLK